MSWALLSNASYLADPISGPASNVNAMYHTNFITVEYSGSVMLTSSSFTSCTSKRKATIVVRNACMAFPNYFSRRSLRCTIITVAKTRDCRGTFLLRQQFAVSLAGDFLVGY